MPEVDWPEVETSHIYPRIKSSETSTAQYSTEHLLRQTPPAKYYYISGEYWLGWRRKSLLFSLTDRQRGTPELRKKINVSIHREQRKKQFPFTLAL